ncbi:hypothetical protein [Pseudomonas aeruginosa]|uniref:hypothetical protein n=1 Tax=Pseudomonas aeruginosa TaxID=287 RepID=UPI000A3A59B1|nr:hypothetical protein [Pseudomonas aeruginosa]ELP1282590.1 hypothetical protein [Pseudomonas aeruginosa]MCT4840541.1 hypothetical protein [Pseudomonas aeruginosa]MDI2336966.1 hypothetical protein [Pseudomonas aeruginosa]MDI2371041.1 hypothetical protein [Pseudomonas aeruginosa]MDL4522847.1 hypothetical protein [Pseudomonas aeruginosa]
MQTATAGELINVLTAKRKQRLELSEAAKVKESDFVGKLHGLITRSADMLKPLEPFGISTKVEDVSYRLDFGFGLVAVELLVLRVLDGKDELLSLEPKVLEASPTVPFCFAKYGPKTRSIVWKPADQEPGWYFWTNDDDKSLTPKYLRFNEDSLMGLIKSIVE